MLAPAPGLAPGRRARPQDAALRIAKELGVIGLLAVEMFEHRGGPRWSTSSRCARTTPATGPIEGARTSQFEQHLRAVLDLPLGVPAAAPAAVMANVLGGDDAGLYDRYIHVMAADPAVKVHMYGKQVRPGRKIGHVTVLGEDLADLADRARRAASYLRDGARRTADEREAPVVGIVMGSDSDWPVMEAAAEALDEFEVPLRGRRGIRAPDAARDDRVRLARPNAAACG